MKHIETLIQDIYQLVSTSDADDSVDVDAEIDKFGEAIKDLMRNQFTGDKRPPQKHRLRLSAIGRKDKYLWNQYHGTDGEKIQPHTYVKFLYGHVIEELLLFLSRLAGHRVESEQKECYVDGVKGHMDCRIDGVVTDVKSASSYGFKKFKQGTIAQDDAFGYVDQLEAYAHSEGANEYGWLAMDKQNGHLTYLKQKANKDIVARVQHVKELVKGDEPKELCYQPVPDGKSGNTKLAIGCSYCQFKKHCYPKLRAFNYSTGIRFLNKVVKEPNVQEITL